MWNPKFLSAVGMTLLAAGYAAYTASGALADPLERSTTSQQRAAWAGDLRPTDPSGFIGGRATMVAVGRDSTKVSVLLIGADTANAYPWRLQKNECGAKTGEVVSGPEFPMIKVSSQSGPTPTTSGTAVAVLPMHVPTSGKYSVTVLASAQDTVTRLACADLVKGAPLNVP